MESLRLQLGPLETNCWIVSDGRGGPSVVVDPAGDYEDLRARVLGRDISAIVLTHGHFDHLAAAEELVAETGAPLYVGRADGERITSETGTGGEEFGFPGHVARGADHLLDDGDTVTAGRLELRVLATPGHTQGSISLIAEDPQGGPPQLFSGDTLFAGSVGRTDFSGGDARAMRSSIARLAELADGTVVHPGHGPDTTIGRERARNPFWPIG